MQYFLAIDLCVNVSWTGLRSCPHMWISWPRTRKFVDLVWADMRSVRNFWFVYYDSCLYSCCCFFNVKMCVYNILTLYANDSAVRGTAKF